jgi:hypothetical protein
LDPEARGSLKKRSPFAALAVREVVQAVRVQEQVDVEREVQDSLRDLS